MSSDMIMREQLVKLLIGRNAHLNIDDAVSDFPEKFINAKPPNVAYKPWHIVEHIRIAQKDILDFMLDPSHVSPSWPEGYWPTPSSQASPVEWQAILDAFRTDLRTLVEMAKDVDVELTAELPHAPGYTYIREFLLVADHNAYHIGEFAILRQIMGTWPTSRTS